MQSCRHVPLVSPHYNLACTHVNMLSCINCWIAPSYFIFIKVYCKEIGWVCIRSHYYQLINKVKGRSGVRGRSIKRSHLKIAYSQIKLTIMGNYVSVKKNGNMQWINWWLKIHLWARGVEFPDSTIYGKMNILSRVARQKQSDYTRLPWQDCEK